jgi:hypothetical protein
MEAQICLVWDGDEEGTAGATADDVKVPPQDSRRSELEWLSQEALQARLDPLTQVISSFTDIRWRSWAIRSLTCRPQTSGAEAVESEAYDKELLCDVMNLRMQFEVS